MIRYSKALCSLILLLLPMSALAVQKQPAPAAPVPAQILAAKKIFIANGGWDEPFYNGTIFTGGPGRAYNEFYAAIKSSGRFELVTSPADADLIFELEFTVPKAGPRISAEPTLAEPPYDPTFHLRLRDPKTNALLWTIVQHSQWAILEGNRDKNFDLALNQVVVVLQMLMSPSPAPSDAANE